MGLLFANNVSTTLAVAITDAGATSCTVTSATGMPSPGGTDWFYLTISDGSANATETAWEVVKVTNVSGTTLTIVRGQDNTSAATWPINYYIQGRPNVQAIRDAMATGLTTLGDTDYCSATQADAHSAGTVTRLAGPTTNAAWFLRENVTATAAVIPDWFNLFGTANTWSSAQTLSLAPVLTQGATFTAYAGGTVDGLVWNDTTQESLGRYHSQTKVMTPGIMWTKTATTSLASWTAATSALGVVGTGVGTLTIGTAAMVLGKMIMVKMRGTMGSSASAPTMTLALTLGGTSVCTTGAATMAASLSNRGWWAEFLLTCRATGASGFVMGQGNWHIGTAAAGANLNFPTNTTATAAANTTGALAIDVTAACGTSSAANALTITNAYVEILN